MKNNHLAESIFGESLKLKHWQRLHSIQVICPWCYNPTEYDEKREVSECEVCRRRITEGDLENDIL